MIKVAVIDDHPVFRQGLVTLVQATIGLELVGQAASVEEYDLTSPADIVVLDLGLPGLAGSEAVGHIRAAGPGVLVVSADGHRDQVIDAVAAGAAGYLTKSAHPSEITDAIRVTAEGGTYVSPTLASFFISVAREPGPPASLLTPREKEIVALVAAGERDIDIGELLFISVRTVRSHLDRVRDKTGLRRRPDLTRLALHEGLIKDA